MQKTCCLPQCLAYAHFQRHLEWVQQPNTILWELKLKLSQATSKNASKGRYDIRVMKVIVKREVS